MASYLIVSNFMVLYLMRSYSILPCGIVSSSISSWAQDMWNNVFNSVRENIVVEQQAFVFDQKFWSHSRKKKKKHIHATTW